MLDFFAVITKGGLVLWYFQDAAQRLDSSINAINALIKNVVLQERSGGMGIYDHGNLALKMILDNEFELMYVASYQKILKLSYVDKFLSDIQRKFRDAFISRLQQKEYYKSFDFSGEYGQCLQAAEEESKVQRCVPSRPRTFQESEKSQKTLSSMVEKTTFFSTNKATFEQPSKKKKKKKGKGAKQPQQQQECNNNKEATQSSNFDDGEMSDDVGESDECRDVSNDVAAPVTTDEGLESGSGSESRDGSGGSASDGALPPTDAILRNRQMMFRGKRNKANVPKKTKKGKEARVWDLANKDSTCLDYSRKGEDMSSISIAARRPEYLPDTAQVGTLGGSLRNMDVPAEQDNKKTGMFALFQSLVSGKSLDSATIEPVLEKFRDNLIAKNVASEIANKLCASVESKLIGKHVGSFEGVRSVVGATLTESLMQLLTPRRRLDILRDVKEAQANAQPYTIAFCGVNGVGKSTNLAKVCFWLVENNFRVLIAACDTFRAGAVEQLRTHTRHLNALHPPETHGGVTMVQLYEQGYGKDAADIARMAIDYGRKNSYDVVLVDTAGRMQDNEPLMRALAKLILVNEPDLTLFVGEALVGNEAVDQLVKFNRALANHSSATSAHTHMIDGILLTKFDTIDDKVGAAISMTYITGQPIVFVGTGQTYADLRNLDAKAIVHLLMK